MTWYDEEKRALELIKNRMDNRYNERQHRQSQSDTPETIVNQLATSIITSVLNQVDVQNLIDGAIAAITNPVTQTIEGETAVDTGETGGTPLNLSEISAQEVFIEITGKDNAGTFNSCTVELQRAMTDTDASYKKIATATLSASGVEGGNIDDHGALFIRHKITAIDLTGDADVDVLIGGKV